MPENTKPPTSAQADSLKATSSQQALLKTAIEAGLDSFQQGKISDGTVVIQRLKTRLKNTE